MILQPRHQPMTADEFLLVDNKGFELVDGRMQEKNMGAFSSSAAVWIFSLLLSRFDWRLHGEFLDSEGGYQCWPKNPRRVRKPDISFIRRERIPGGKIIESWLRVAPDFVIEVMSKNDTLREVEEKIEEYLEVGVPWIWVVDPKRREVRVYRPNASPQLLNNSDELRDDAVLPGFRCTAEELFAPE